MNTPQTNGFARLGSAALGLFLLSGEVARAQTQEPALSHLSECSSLFFILIDAVMILAMHGGFAFLEAGSVRKKNQVNALNKILCEWSFSTLIYFLIGYPIARGISMLKPVAELSAHSGFEYVKFFFLLGFAACIPAIISGGVAERAKFWTNAIAGGIFVGIVYPLIEGCTWGQYSAFLGDPNGTLAGWFGAPFHDFAGSAARSGMGRYSSCRWRNVSGFVRTRPAAIG